MQSAEQPLAGSRQAQGQENDFVSQLKRSNHFSVILLDLVFKARSPPAQGALTGTPASADASARPQLSLACGACRSPALGTRLL